MTILIPVSPGELADKMSVLMIKEARITDGAKLKNIQSELAILTSEFAKLTASPELSQLVAQLRAVNEAIWDAEEAVRAPGVDDVAFLAAARLSHSKNDERFHLKRRINDLLGSTVVEEKSHQ
jgi:hypothetical protein